MNNKSISNHKTEFPSFKESIIIPIALWKQCTLSKQSSFHEDPLKILKSNIPADRKMPLYNTKRIQVKKKTNENKIPGKKIFGEHVSETSSKDKEIRYIAQQIHISKRPYIESMLKFIQENPDVLAWNKQHEIIIEGIPIPDTNIIKIFQLFAGMLPLTSSKDYPKGAQEVYDKLIDGGIPKSWFSKTPKRTQPGRMAKQIERKSQSPRKKPSSLASSSSRKTVATPKLKRKKGIQHISKSDDTDVGADDDDDDDDFTDADDGSDTEKIVDWETPFP